MNRDFRLDFLRVLSIFLIFLAHTNPPNNIFQLRNFDVISMVLVSGMSFALSYTNINYYKYIFKRIKRLLIPAWKFLTVFFVFFYLLSLVSISNIFNLSIILRSYLLVDGIGYVWIIKVFLFLAIINPFLYSINKKIKHNRYFLFIVVLLVLLQKFAIIPLGTILPSPINYLYDRLIGELFGYSIVSLIGIRIISFSRRQIGFFILFTAGWYLIEAIINGFSYVQEFKYPPDSYFISYGLLMTLVIYYCIFELKDSTDSFIIWTSKNSLEIYYWHIFAIYSLNRIVPFGTLHFLIYYVYYLVFAFTVTYIQKKYLSKLL